jgi:predicted CXXCH cytochrome family protein
MKLLIWMVVMLISDNAMTHEERGRQAQAAAPQPGCLECHGDLIQQEVVHPVAEDACDNCHLSDGKPHPGEDPGGFTLMDSLPELCFYCHTEPEEMKYGHLPVEEKDCLACHDVHGSSEPRLLTQPGQELCLSCHGGSGGAASDGINISRLVSGNRLPHSAIAMGGCNSCHLPHGANERALLVEYYGMDSYLPATVDNFALCFQCHDSDLLVAEETEWGTNFRNGSKNLHWLHIRGNKGRNCRMCHNMHGSSQPFLIEERVQYGDWEMEMHFEQTENGGSCLPGCHGRFQYER